MKGYTSNMKYCKFCCNAVVEPELTPDNDLSYHTIGETDNGFNMYFRSGGNRPTVIEVSQWNQQQKQNFDIGVYKMNFCPECGRKLIENVACKKK